MSRQSQRGGDDATNLQVGRDVVVHQGTSLEEVREIALGVFRDNFLELRGIAEDIARARVDKITEDFVEKLQAQPAAALQSVADPDMQRAIYNAQVGYACSGDDDLEEALVEMLVDRAGVDRPGMRRIVLNEAITAVPKLPLDQRRAIALCFLVKYTALLNPVPLDQFYEGFMKGELALLSRDLPQSMAAYQHIEYVGAGSVTISHLSLLGALSEGRRPWFTQGMSIDECPDPLRPHFDDDRLFMPALRDPARRQLRAMRKEDLPALAKAAGVDELADLLPSVYDMGALAHPEIKAEILERAPELAGLLDTWDNSGLPNLTLTTVGLAIGHSYWQRVTGGSAPLNIWIGD